ncbi:phage Gp37/Gp68 family protein [Agrobacterium vitis]|uniref:phage Gp37/Gp68 family protein n=1 Tax=Agrobacterium vitis TaxID=373 RepID=UPI00157218FF|nr:phage Gp37/Gp68 family protein [Agrobacterium vitis]NSY21926.1 phage Gp37/Gp68 family protein [Agrobacterium vitis]WEO73217.1 phage Gp37/Gp68 family protein [Agrobacterium vitis]
MADNTPIEWTDATWNPITGCSIVSPACTNCYAMKLAGTRLQHHPSRAGLTKDSKAGPVWTGEVRFNAQWLTEPLKWKRPRMIFVCAHGDLFAEGVPDEWIDQVFAVMALAPHHTFQVLTKRPERMWDYMRQLPKRTPHISKWAAWHWGKNDPDAVYEFVVEALKTPPSNIWLGVSVEDQSRAEQRIPILLDTPAAVRWISAEPLLGGLDLTDMCQGNWFFDALRGTRWHDVPEFTSRVEQFARGLDWVVAGGESGRNARPMHPDWARSLRDQCAAAGVPFLFKQWGQWAPLQANDGEWPTDRLGFCRINMDGKRSDDGWPMQKITKKAAGRLLDSVEHNGFPVGRAA